MAFCHQCLLHPLPLTDFNLCRFVSVLHDQQLSPSSIRLYLSSLRFFQISSGGQDPCLAEFPRLHYVIRAVKHQNTAYQCPSRLPITPAILRHLHAVWSVPLRSIDSYMLWACMLLRFLRLPAVWSSLLAPLRVHIHVGPIHALIGGHPCQQA